MCITGITKEKINPLQYYAPLQHLLKVLKALTVKLTALLRGKIDEIKSTFPDSEQCEK